MMRVQYLHQIGMAPRNKSNTKHMYAGWKNLPVERNTHQTEAYFIHQSLENEFVNPGAKRVSEPVE